MGAAESIQHDLTHGVTDGEEQYLTFMLADTEYGVDILKVDEIKGWQPVTPIPNTPPYVKGVINLRGSIIPIVDLRERFGMEGVEYGPTTVVIVLKVQGEDRERSVGVIVDAVSDVHSLPATEVKAAPNFGDDVDVGFIHGMAEVDDKTVIVLDADSLLGVHELSDTAMGQ